jgi:dTDP-4-dehydrorhamnose 3,5-epimerase
MRVENLGLRGAYLSRGIETRDERGTFSRRVDFQLLTDLGFDSTINQVSTATNSTTGTLRGLHFQVFPDQESKTVWCESGSIFDVLLDLRRSEPTYGTWISLQLEGSDLSALHIPPGIAHGYQTTSPDTSVSYLISAPHEPRSARRINPFDEKLSIGWPLAATVISAHDRDAPSWRELNEYHR